MKKAIFVLSFVVMFSVSGMDNFHMDRIDTVSLVSLEPIKMNNWGLNLSSMSLPQNVEKGLAFDFLTEKELDSQTEKKIDNFINKLKKKNVKARNPVDLDMVKKALIEYCTQPDVPVREIAERNGIMGTTLFNWKARAGLSLRRKLYRQNKINTSVQVGLDCFEREKIYNFSRNMNHRIYSAEQIEKALIDWVTKGRNESNSISHHSLYDWSQKLGITLSRVPLKDEEKQCLLCDYRKRLFTRKGLAKKYGVRESDVFCIIREARHNGEDLTPINIKIVKKYSCANPIPALIKEKLVEDYNQDWLTLKGLGVKYDISTGVVERVLFKEKSDKIKRKSALRIEHNMVLKRYETLVLDIKNKSPSEIEEMYGYKTYYANELKRYATYWEQLADDQKKLFKTTMESKIMPPDEVLSSIKYSSNNVVNEKFKRLLFVLLSTREEIEKEYNLSAAGANKLLRNVKLWKVLAKEM